MCRILCEAIHFRLILDGRAACVPDSSCSTRRCPLGFLLHGVRQPQEDTQAVYRSWKFASCVSLPALPSDRIRRHCLAGASNPSNESILSRPGTETIGDFLRSGHGMTKDNVHFMARF